MANDINANRRNGITKKTIKIPTGNVELATRPDRNGSFEP
ncbi:TPA: transposase [Providencia stuartii]|nr:transposase [Providencia stuartii]